MGRVCVWFGLGKVLRAGWQPYLGQNFCARMHASGEACVSTGNGCVSTGNGQVVRSDTRTDAHPFRSGVGEFGEPLGAQEHESRNQPMVRVRHSHHPIPSTLAPSCGGRPVLGLDRGHLPREGSGVPPGIEALVASRCRRGCAEATHGRAAPRCEILAFGYEEHSGIGRGRLVRPGDA